jgi:hypothetical protein
MIGFYFREIMEGTVQREGERFDRPFRFELDVTAPSLLGFATTAVGEAEGTVTLDGLAKDAKAKGRLELSPFHRQTIRYVLDFEGTDGKKYRFDGSKKTTVRRHLVGWTTLPGAIYDADGAEWGRASLRFSLPRHLPRLLRSIKLFPSGSRPLSHA